LDQGIKIYGKAGVSAKNALATTKNDY